MKKTNKSNLKKYECLLILDTIGKEEAEKEILDRVQKEIQQAGGKVETVQKMGQKRALIAATLIAVNASEFYTQDMEDFATDPDGAYIGSFVVRSTEPEKLHTEPRDTTTVDMVAMHAGQTPVSPAAQVAAWKVEIINLGKRAGELLASAPADKAALLSSAQALARDTLRKNGEATGEEIAFAMNTLNNAIEAAEMATIA